MENRPLRATDVFSEECLTGSKVALSFPEVLCMEKRPLLGRRYRFWPRRDQSLHPVGFWRHPTSGCSQASWPTASSDGYEYSFWQFGNAFSPLEYSAQLKAFYVWETWRCLGKTGFCSTPPEIIYLWLIPIILAWQGVEKGWAANSQICPSACM